MSDSPSAIGTLYVPEVHRAVFRKVASLPRDAFQDLVSAVAGLDATDSRAAMVGQLREAAKLDAETLLAALISARITMEYYHRTPRETAAALFATDADVPPEAIERLTQLFESNGLLAISKPVSVLIENEHNFVNARIVTDIRPVFADVNDEPVSYILIHNLKVEYTDQDEIRSVFFALDSNDLETLQRVLTREVAKKTTLLGVVSKHLDGKLFDPRERDEG